MNKSRGLHNFLGRISKWKMYDELLVAKETMDNSQYGLRRNANFYVDYRGFYSGHDRVTYIYTIDKYPKELEISYRTKIRDACSEGVRVNFITDIDYEPIKWSSMSVKSKLRVWESIDEEQEEVSVYSAHNEIRQQDDIEWRRSSVDYLTKACKRRGRNTFRVKTIMLISGVRSEEFDDSIENIHKVMRDDLGLAPRRIIYDILGFLGAFSPFSNDVTGGVLRKVSSILVPDEILARLSTYSQGSVGKYGTWFGNDMDGRPVFKPTKRESVTPENWLVGGETGSGKSCLIKGLTGQLLVKPNYIGTYMDVEGDEYLAWLYLLENDEKVLHLDVSEGQGKYIDPVEIVETGVRKLDKGMYANSYNFTRALLCTLADASANSREWVDSAIKSSILSFYEKIGVSPTKRNTWKNSKNHTIYDIIEELGNFKTYTDEESATLRLCLENIRVNLSLLREPVSIQDVISAKLVVCSFNMKGRQENTIDPVSMSCMQLVSAYVSYIRSVCGCAMGKYNVKIWDEFQRWGHFPDSDKTVGVAITGGRKLGDINIIGTNKLSELLKHDTLNILENITTYAIGAIDDSETIHSFCKLKSIENLEPELLKIAKYSKKLDGYVEGDKVIENEYTHAFLCCLDSVRYVVTYMELPDGVVQSDLFYTGIDEGDNEDVE